jgi:hypothetical protein
MLFLGILLIAAAALVWRIPAWRYPILGVLRREPFFRGMPASYWRDRFLEFEAKCEREKREWREVFDGRQPFTSRLRDYLEAWIPAIRRPEIELPELFDSEAIPVLIVLLHDDDPVAWGRASDALSMIGTPAIPALVKFMQEGTPKIRMRSILTFNAIIEPGTAAFPGLRQLTKDQDKRFAVEAIARLSNRDAGYRDNAVFDLIELVKEPDTWVRKEAICILGDLLMNGLSEQSHDAALRTIEEGCRDSDRRLAECARWVLGHNPAGP